TIGASASQLGAMYLAFALAVGLASCLVSLPLAAAIARPYAAMRGEMLNFPLEGFSVPLWVFALQAVVGALLPVAAAAFAVRRAVRMPVGHALRDEGRGPTMTRRPP